MLILFLASGCGTLKEVFQEIKEDVPTSENTYFDIQDISLAMLEAIERGEPEFTFNIAEFEEEDLAHLGDDMPTFWGRPDTYSVNHQFADMKDIAEDRTVDVKNVTANFKYSNNYYVYHHIVNGQEIPEDMPHARTVADMLPVVANEIFSALPEDASDYDKALAAHDWLVANLTYDDTVDNLSDMNGSYGALYTRSTMCRGYAETFNLLMKCYTDVQTEEVVGDACQETGSSWLGHAWNIVYIDGAWRQVDATFDDPENNPSGTVLHYYFGQSDDVMRVNHEWEASFYPACEAEDFYYFRKSGLFAGDEDAFKEIVTGVFEGAEEDPEFLQIAAVGVEPDKDNVQFIFGLKTDKKMSDSLYISEQVYEDIHLLTMQFRYED
ncbi:MAG: hypothetical protein LBR44_06325 [Clostridiales Family XIII bacterium]|nr:hypothetical protein [Clostridiales Family XIII bacterium]